jgi:hypothetical protein
MLDQTLLFEVNNLLLVTMQSAVADSRSMSYKSLWNKNEDNQIGQINRRPSAEAS